MDNAGVEVLRRADAIVNRAKLQVLTERAIAALEGTPGMCYMRLYPPLPAIFVVTYYGQLLGQVRLKPHASRHRRCLATPEEAKRPLGSFPTTRLAAAALAEAAGFELFEIPSWNACTKIDP